MRVCESPYSCHPAVYDVYCDHDHDDADPAPFFDYVARTKTAIGAVLACNSAASFVVRSALPRLIARLTEARLLAFAFFMGTASLIEQRAVLCGDSHARLKPIRPLAQAANHGRELDRKVAPKV